MDCFEDKASIETPSEGAEVARQMFGGDHSVGGEQAVLDIGEHGVRPAEGRVACSSAIGAGDVALMDDTFGPRQVRTRLLAGAREIRTLGPSSQHSRSFLGELRCQEIETERFEPLFLSGGTEGSNPLFPRRRVLSRR